MSTAPLVSKPPPVGPKPRPPSLRARATGGLGRFARGLVAGPQRMTILAVFAAIVGLAVAGYGLLQPTVKEAITVPAGVVALVNGEPILMTDYVSETEQALGTPFDMISPAEKAKALRGMVDQELLVQRALALDLPEQDTNVRSALGDSVTALVTAPIGGASTGSAAAPSDDARLQAYFIAHKANYATRGSMNLIDLVLRVGGYENVEQTVDQALADAKQAAYELKSGANIDYIKSHFSFVDSGKVNGDEADFAARIHLGDKLYKVAETLNDGAISDPVADTDGVHLLVMVARTAPVFYDYASVKNNVYTDYLTDQKARAKAENLVFLRRNAKILIAPGHSE
jgi:hypothetical protein